MPAIPPPTVLFTSRAAIQKICRNDGALRAGSTGGVVVTASHVPGRHGSAAAYPEARSYDDCSAILPPMRVRSALAVAVLAVVVASRPPIDAQVRDVYDLGADGLVQVLERLQTTASVLHTGAHPDDEDSAFLAREARGDRARVAYLALNRGEGGQNIIGPELFEALGVIRTEELLQARRLDGGQQFFTRTFDYGFSKSREEAA